MYRSLTFGAILFFSCSVAQTAHAFSLSPSRQTVVVEPGSTTELYVEVTNDEQEEIFVKPTVGTFQIDSQTGGVILSEEAPEISWVTPKQTQRAVATGQTDKLSFSIQTPEKVTPGAYYFTLFAEQSAGEGQVGVGSRIGSLVFFYIEGEVTESLETQIFATDKSWYTTDTIVLHTQLTNNGNIHVIPQGDIAVKNNNGDTIQNQQINESQTKVLANGQYSRRFEFSGLTWKDAGKININAQIQYGTQGKVRNEFVSVWYIPRELLITAIAGVLVFSMIIIIMSARYGAKK